MLRVRKNNSEDKSENIYMEETEDSDLVLTSANIKKLITDSNDVVFRQLYINNNNALPVTMVFIEGLINIKLVDDDILKPLSQEMSLSNTNNSNEIINHIEHGILYHVSQKTRENLNTCINDIIDGSVALIFDDVQKAVTFDVKGFEKRTITEPTGENVIKGSKDSFVENLRTNTATVRRKIKTYKLAIEETKVGKQTLTKVSIIYIKGLTNEHILKEVKKRLDGIEYDNALTAGVIEEWIIDYKHSLFPQIDYTERPDKFCAGIIQGRIGILVDGLPISFILPSTLNQFLQAPEDYANNFIVSSFTRFLRFISMFTTLLLPGFYISIVTFHHEMIPTELALSIQAAKEGVPFPTFAEVGFMLIAFEILLEAGLRLPKNIGQAVSIVGAVVVGQAAVNAKFVSPAVVVVISLTAIATYTMPNQDLSNALRIWRLFFVILASILGLYGLSLGSIVLLIGLSNKEMFGVPYLSPFVSEDDKQLQNTIFRFPFSSMYKRPIGLKTTNKKRIG